MASRFQLVTPVRGATILPHNGWINRLSGGSIPDQGGFTLIGHPQRSHLTGLDAGFGHGLLAGLDQPVHDF